VPTLGALARRAEALGAPLPPLLVAAQRVAATVAQGVHGRRRAGLGDSFWQFRPFVAGDASSRIDWRQSAKSSRAYIRETEWEAAHTVSLWRDGSASMHWRSRRDLPSKAERADLLLLALAALLLRGGERVSLLPMAGGAAARAGQRATQGRSGLERIAAVVGTHAAQPDAEGGLPKPGAVPRHVRLVLIGDFLSPLADIRAMVAAYAAIPVRGHLLQVLDPAETELPFDGRVRFSGLEQESERLIPRVESIRAAYRDRLAAQQDGVRAICSAAGWTSGQHRTDHGPEAALLGLYSALATRTGPAGGNAEGFTPT
jgi:uncharacterized protein (DUF58 family)